MERGMLLLLCVADTISVCKVMNIFSGKMDFKKIFVVYQCDKSDSDRILQAPGVSEGQGAWRAAVHGVTSQIQLSSDRISMISNNQHFEY